MDAHRDSILRRIRERLDAIQRLRAEALELRAELVHLANTLQQAQEELARVRAEVAATTEPRRAAELAEYAHELVRAAHDAEEALAAANLDARLEIHEIEVGLATEDALRLRAQADELAARRAEEDRGEDPS